jgi:hypothetical protein
MIGKTHSYALFVDIEAGWQRHDICAAQTEWELVIVVAPGMEAAAIAAHSRQPT